MQNLPHEKNINVVLIMEVTYQHQISSRGWHVYAKDVWRKPRTGERLFAEKERDSRALVIDPYAVAFLRRDKSKLIPVVVGHIPQEISRFVFYFLERGGKVEGEVLQAKYYPSPIPKGGLEIPLVVTFKISREKEAIITRLIDRIQQNYEPVNLDYGQSDDIDFVVASGNEETENELDELDKGIILIDDENEEE